MYLTQIVVYLALTLSPMTDNFYYDVAARCKGEASFAIKECAATVRNRIEVGWNKNKVLDAYYAPDITPTEEEVHLVRDAFEDENYLPTVYFMLGDGLDDWYKKYAGDYVMTVRKENSNLSVSFYTRFKK